MIDIPITLALTIIAGIATISLTIYKIVGNKKSDTINAVQEEKIKELRKDVDKLTDLILDLLKSD